MKALLVLLFLLSVPAISKDGPSVIYVKDMPSIARLVATALKANVSHCFVPSKGDGSAPFVCSGISIRYGKKESDKFDALILDSNKFFSRHGWILVRNNLAGLVFDDHIQDPQLVLSLTPSTDQPGFYPETRAVVMIPSDLKMDSLEAWARGDGLVKWRAIQLKDLLTNPLVAATGPVSCDGKGIIQPSRDLQFTWDTAHADPIRLSELDIERWKKEADQRKRKLKDYFNSIPGGEVERNADGTFDVLDPERKRELAELLYNYMDAEANLRDAKSNYECSVDCNAGSHRVLREEWCKKRDLFQQERSHLPGRSGYCRTVYETDANGDEKHNEKGELILQKFCTVDVPFEGFFDADKWPPSISFPL